jgi:hypothetical protein
MIRTGFPIQDISGITVKTLLNNFLKQSFIIFPVFICKNSIDGIFQIMKDETLSFLIAGIKIPGTDERFHAIGKQCLLGSAPGELLTLAHMDNIVDTQSKSYLGQSILTDYVRLDSGKIAFRPIGK